MGTLDVVDERVRVRVTLLGEEIELVLPGDGWSFDEAKVAKQVSEGMAPAVIEGNLLVGDPDAWMAVLRVSYMRADREFPAQRLAGEGVLELMKALSDATREAMKQRPPTNPSGSESPDSADTSEPDATEPTPVPS